MAYINNNKKRSNYFTQNIMNNGPNFLNSKNAKDLQYDAVRILRDIARGAVDVREYYDYMCNTQLINAIIFVSGQKIDFHSVSAMSVGFYINCASTNPQMMLPETIYSILDDHQKTAYVYGVVSEAFRNFKVSLNVDFLLPMAGQLRNYRQYI